jgi:hypothetical protein
MLYTNSNGIRNAISAYPNIKSLHSNKDTSHYFTSYTIFVTKHIISNPSLT